MLETLRSQLRELLDQRAAAQTALDDVLAAPAAEARDLTADEAAAFAERRDALAAIDGQIDPLQARVDELAQLEARRAAATAAAAQIGSAAPARVGNEARTYNPDAERRGVSFLADIAAGQLRGDAAANERLSRHMAEERVERPALEQRAVGTGAFGGLTVPTYLTDLYAPNAKRGRPLANICRRNPLPASGMTVELSRITTGSSTAVQTQNNAASETDMDDTALSLAVQTIAGQQTVSRQALERGTNIESVVLGDLIASYNTTLDSTLINQATNGLDAVTDNNVDVAYTDDTPTAAELWPKLFDGVQQIQSAVFGQATANAILMHPRRFWWMASQVGTSFPFVNLTGAGAQSGGSVTSAGYEQGPSGFLAGLPVYVDANIVTNGGAGTNQDRIYILSTDECHLFEDDVMFIRAEQTAAASLGVLFVVYGYMAYTFSRYPSANARIAGTGLATPSF